MNILIQTNYLGLCPPPLLLPPERLGSEREGSERLGSEREGAEKLGEGRSERTGSERGGFVAEVFTFGVSCGRVVAGDVLLRVPEGALYTGGRVACEGDVVGDVFGLVSEGVVQVLVGDVVGRVSLGV